MFRVLIVDDDGQIARKLDMALTSCKYQTMQAGNLAEAEKYLIFQGINCGIV